MCDPCHVDRSGRVVNDIHNPVITNTNPPYVVAALKFLAARRSGDRPQLFETRHHAGNHLRGQSMQFSFPRLWLTQPCSYSRVSLPLFINLAFTLSSGVRFSCCLERETSTSSISSQSSRCFFRSI